MGVALRADEGAEVADAGLVDVAEVGEVLEQLAGGVAMGAARPADAEGAAGLVVVPGHHAAAAHGAEGEPRGEHAGRLRRASLGVEEGDGARALEVALDRAARLLVRELGGARAGLDQPAGPPAYASPPAPRRGADLDLVGTPVEEVGGAHEAGHGHLASRLGRRRRLGGLGRGRPLLRRPVRRLAHVGAGLERVLERITQRVAERVTVRGRRSQPGVGVGLQVGSLVEPLAGVVRVRVRVVRHASSESRRASPGDAPCPHPHRAG